MYVVVGLLEFGRLMDVFDYFYEICGMIVDFD